MFEGIEWLFFDVGSTLVDESKAYEERLKIVAETANVSYEYVYQISLDFYKENKKGDLETMRLLNVEKPKWRFEDEVLYCETEECLRRLSEKYKIGVIANQSLGTKERLAQKGILKYIDLVIASAEEGVAKPDRRIFEIALERSNCKAANSVMIGDRIDNDIVPANLMCMNTIWIKQGFGQYWKISQEIEKPDFVVNNLLELCDILIKNVNPF